MWLRDNDRSGRALVRNEPDGLVFETTAIEGSIRLLGIKPSDIGLNRVGDEADVELTPETFREGKDGGTHYLKATIDRVVNTSSSSSSKPSSPDRKSAPESGKSTNKMALASVTRNSKYVSVEAWVNVVGNFGPDYVQQKVWLGDESDQEVPLVINEKYDGNLVRSEHKYRFENVRGNYNQKQSEVQLIANHSSSIKHLRSKKGTSKPKWRDK